MMLCPSQLQQMDRNQHPYITCRTLRADENTSTGRGMLCPAAGEPAVLAWRRRRAPPDTTKRRAIPWPIPGNPSNRYHATPPGCCRRGTQTQHMRPKRRAMRATRG